MPAPASPPNAQFAATVADGAGSHTVSLSATMAAPLPDVEDVEVPIHTTLSSSVLPRIEASPLGTRLVPNEGPRYERGRVLGTGGMGEVALAEDRDIGRKVALKRLHVPASGNKLGAAALARFVDEVRTVGQLEHPNIVPIHDVGVDDAGNFFFVMKFVDGMTLEDVIEKLKAGDAATVAEFGMVRRAEIFVGILRALEYAHERGVIHRDLKPANVMIGKNGEVILMDWGVARPIARPEPDAPTVDLAATEQTRASATHAGSLIGTPLYMSPEQAAGRNSTLDQRSDLYAACQMFYELLSLHHRFEDSANLVQLLAAIQTTSAGANVVDFARAHLSAAAVPAELGHFLRKGLALDPKDRWQSASEMLLEMEMIADGRCRIQCPATGMKRSTREFTRLIDRSPTGAMVLVGSVAMSVLSLMGLAVYGLLT